VPVKYHNQIKIFTGLLLFAWAPVFCAEKIYMPFFELINVHSDYQYSTARLFKSYVDELLKYQLVIPGKSDSAVDQPSMEEVQALSKTHDCPYFILGVMNRVGETVIISVSMYKTGDASMMWSDKLKASSPEDIDPILQKLARSIGTAQKAAKDGDIYSVTSYEAQQLRKVRVNNAFGVSLGGVLTFLSDEPFSAGGGIFWFYDARSILFEIDGQAYPLGDNSLGFFSIGTYYPFSALSQTPFLGGGLGVGFTSSDSESADGSGLILYLGGGYMINRISNVGLRVHGRYFIGAYKMDDRDRSIPHGLLLNVELYFGK
jgi:TolB-like protein